MIYVVAGSRAEASSWAAAMQLGTDDWKLVDGPQVWEGLDVPEHEVVVVGLPEDVPNISAIMNAPRRMVPSESSYCIRADYRHRRFARQSEVEAEVRDECQDEVYATAREFASSPFFASPARRILDVGCGGGFKLVKWFPKERGFATTGLDSERTVAYLRQVLPYRSWAPVNIEEQNQASGALCFAGLYDLVVCSDVVEHLYDPDALVGFLRGVGSPVVLSTPNRDALPQPWAQGPPRNRAHSREWSFDEFHSYLAGHGFEFQSHVPNWAGASSQIAVGVFA